MRIIDLEAHFIPRQYFEFTRHKQISKLAPQMETLLVDLGEKRLSAMDHDSINIQVLSSSQPHVQQMDAEEGLAWSRIINDELSTAVRKHPDRFIGLASIAPQDPEKAAEEIERAVTELGLKGICLQSHSRDEYLDDIKYRIIFKKADELDVPIYIHPVTPSAGMLKAYDGYGQLLSGATLGFGAEVSLHSMRLICSGIFDEYPDLKILLGHMGEGLPFWLPRLDIHFNKPLLKARKGTPQLEKNPSDYIKRNFFATTSGMFFQPALLCSYLAIGAEHLCFAVDYPYENNQEAVKFLEEAPICENDKERIFHSTAEQLFKI